MSGAYRVPDRLPSSVSEPTGAEMTASSLEPVPRSATEKIEVVIRPVSELLRFDLREYYRYRHMLGTLVWRNVRLKFNEMYFGAAWVCVRPLLYMAVFSAFQKLSSANTHVAIPYPLYIYSGLVFWYYFLEATTATAGCVRADAQLLTKVYYPRLITPMVPVIASLLELGVAIGPMLVMMAWYGVGATWRIVLLPVVVLQVMALSLGIGMLVASVNLESRDWDRVLQFGLYLALFVSPVLYAPAMIPQGARPVYFLNPVAGALLAFRGCFFGEVEFPTWQWAYSIVSSAAVFWLGVRCFRKAETMFADRL